MKHLIQLRQSFLIRKCHFIASKKQKFSIEKETNHQPKNISKKEVMEQLELEGSKVVIDTGSVFAITMKFLCS